MLSSGQVRETCPMEHYVCRCSRDGREKQREPRSAGDVCGVSERSSVPDEIVESCSSVGRSWTAYVDGRRILLCMLIAKLR